MAVNFFPKLDTGGTGSLDDYIALTEKGSANGVATLDSTSKIPSNQLPNISITDTFVVGSQSALLALTAQVGDVAIRTDLNKSFILQSEPASVLSNWLELLTPPDSVLSVDGRTGVVSLSDLYQPKTNELTALSALDDVPGIVRKVGNGSYTLDANTYLTANETITLSGDVTGSGTTSINVTLPNIVTAGSSAKPIYNAKGLITGGDSLLASDIPSLDWSKITTGKPTTLNGYGITDALTVAGTGLTATANTINAVGTAGRIVANADSIDLATVGVAGTYAKSTTDAYGRVISGSALIVSDIPLLDANKINNGYYSSNRGNLGTVAGNTLPFADFAYGPGNNNVFKVFAKRKTAGDYWDSSAITIQYSVDVSKFNYIEWRNTNSSPSLFIGIGDSDIPSSDILSINNSGQVALLKNIVSTSTTTGALTINGGVGVQGNQYIGGFSSLGGDASHPAIKIKVLTGTTAETEGGISSVAHGITASKIVSISVLVEWGPNSFLPNSHNIVPGYYFDFYSDSESVFVRNQTANSNNILSKQFKVTIIYTA